MDGIAMKRKEFVKKTGAAALLLSMGVLLESCSDDSEDMLPGDDDDVVSFDLNTSPFDVLQNNDGWLLHPQENILLVNVNNDIRAFTSVCTHTGCTDNWSYTNSNFVCGCHGSGFNNSGAVTSGPATSNLREFTVKVENDQVDIIV